MSVLIKGIDMPEIGENVEHVWVPGWIEVGKDGKAVFCTGAPFDPNTIRSYPIEEVPIPHGDLIDRDHLLDILDKIILKPDSYAQRCMAMATKEILINQPTIIEAEGKT